MPRILMVVGSLRKESFNRQLACEVRRIVGTRGQTTFLDYESLPYMNQDIEFPPPAEVARVRAEVGAADGLWFFSPEYNQQIPGVLKNLLDWLSRPLMANDWERGTAIAGKAATISAATGKGSAAGVQTLLAQLLAYLRMDVVGGVGTSVALAPTSFQTGSLSLAASERQALRDQADLLLARL